ncbi:ropporin-1-like protein [Pteropus vampyrus]|uniref:Ropporin-1-like protein n=1 Tax=Pteropus vampyrus TaxID=132908 RepID=A0A6P3R7W8_PTEVA|nr:ropporin-1-like protein [Pteropus vampyrus]
MPLPDTMFCAQQIHIPPELPDILKQFTKAAIRTQPADVLQWSAGYFSALSRGDPLPVKDRIEMPVATQKTDTGLTQGLLRVLHKQCSHRQYVDLADLEQKWGKLCLPIEKFRALLQLDPCEHEMEWMKFLALGCSMLGGCLTPHHADLVCLLLTSCPPPSRLHTRTRRGLLVTWKSNTEHHDMALRSGSTEDALRDPRLAFPSCPSRTALGMAAQFLGGFGRRPGVLAGRHLVPRVRPASGLCCTPRRSIVEREVTVPLALVISEKQGDRGDKKVESRKNGMIGLSDFFVLRRKM